MINFIQPYVEYCIVCDVTVLIKDGYMFFANAIKNLDYTRRISPKRVTSGRTHLRGLAPGQYCSEKTSQQRRVFSETVLDLIGPGIEPQTSRSDSVRLPIELTSR